MYIVNMPGRRPDGGNNCTLIAYGSWGGSAGDMSLILFPMVIPVVSPIDALIIYIIMKTMKKLNAFLAVLRLREIQDTIQSIFSGSAFLRYAQKEIPELVIEAGQRLTYMKEYLPHVEFISWIEKYCPFSELTARLYIKCYERREEIRTIATSDLSGAYRLIEDLYFGEMNSG